MNIQEAKDEIVRTVRAYTAKDDAGCFRIPVVRQRPVFLVGPPGIGKTAIMEQAAEECGVGLVAYTITHHTRQSAVGLPQLVKRQFEGREYTMTEYTMSEIVGSVYEYQERTGRKEGILFIDEINCVSETLAPTMLQFLQYKTFGNHKVPKGWVIVAAGNPPECNRSVRELDMAAMDRVRTLEVEADFSVWKDYALSRGIHPAILSYLELHPENFYKVTLTHDKREFVTARGWEDLSVLLLEYERQGLLVSPAFMEEFLRNPRIAADFDAFYRLCRTYAGIYRIMELADGKLKETEQKELSEQMKAAPGEARCMFVRHLLAAASERMTSYGTARKGYERKKEVFAQFISYMGEEGEQKPEDFIEKRAHAFQVKKENDLLKPWEEQVERFVDLWLKELILGEKRRNLLEEIKTCPPESRKALPSLGLLSESERLQKQMEELQDFLNRMTDFLLETFGKDLELSDWLHGIRSHGDYKSLKFDRKDLEDILDQRDQEEQLRKNMEQMEVLYETADRI